MTMTTVTEMRFPMLIDGRAVATLQTIPVVNPATEAVIAHVPDCDAASLDDAVRAARAAFPAWRDTPYADRQAALRMIGATLADHADALAALLTAEQGKPIAGALGGIQAAAWWIGVVAEQELPVHVSEALPGQRSVTRQVPLGVVGAIVPWNFPILLAVWKIGPALLTGNTLVLKPSPFTPLATLRLGELLRDALPPGVFNIVTGGDELGPWMTRHPGIDKISFTGSTATGRRVMASASANLKRLTLELGGNDAAIVLDDADVDAIAEPLFWACFANSGQVCVAAKRVYVHDAVYDPLVAALKQVAGRMTVGDGAADGTQLGPVQNRAQYDRVRGLIADSRAAGHRFLTGGDAPDGRGYFVPVTIVDNPPEDARVVQEEAFGPIVPLIRYTDLDDAIARANGCDYGLGGSVWSRDMDRAQAVAARLETGTVWINSAQGLSPFAAFAGHKQSGLGVENGPDGLLEFTTPQSIYQPVGG
jgi:acyl-CoA reductase-like NAD-dependent aldehyde dehydrogenase